MPDAQTLPVGALMSRLLVGFAIEFDNEFEQRMPHRTTQHGATGDPAQVPWLVSMAMWVNCMRFVPAEGITTRELARRARMTSTSAPMIIKRMGRWWGYLRVGSAAEGAGSRLVVPTAAGAQAQRVWQPLAGDVELRWRTRYGPASIDRLRATLATVVGDLPEDLPDFPTVGPRAPARGDRMSVGGATQLGLAALVGRALIVYGDELERRIDLPAPLAANVLRVLDADGVRARDLSRLTGLAQLGIDNSLSVLTRRGLAQVESPRRGKARVVHLTPAGTRMQQAYPTGVADLEASWSSRFGEATITELRAALTGIVGTTDQIEPRLLDGLRPHPGGWRAQLPPRQELPHHPMVSHRGGYPDGS
jgi:hypothetical protein